LDVDYRISQEEIRKYYIRIIINLSEYGQTQYSRLFYNNFDINFAVISISIMHTLVISYIHFLDSFFTIDPAYMDFFKIFAGSIGWIGGLTLFMWVREKQKNSLPHIPVTVNK
jgi:hypothetical protein